jgi:hypothetical protein
MLTTEILSNCGYMLFLDAYTGCLTRYRTRHFFNNFTTNEDMATKFEADLHHCVRNVKEKNVLLFKFRYNICIGVRIIKEFSDSVESGTPCTISLRTTSQSGFVGLVVSVLASGTQARGFQLGRSRRIFKGVKIPSTASFGGEVKPSVPRRRFVEC